MSTNQAQPRSWMASIVLTMVLVSLLVAAVQPKANGTPVQSVSAQEPYAASAHPAPTSVKDLIEHKTDIHRQYAWQGTPDAHESVLS